MDSVISEIIFIFVIQIGYEMSKKRHFGLLMLVLCLVGIGYDGWRLYGKYQTDVLSWKEKSEALFEEALLMELDKRGNIPVRVKIRTAGSQCVEYLISGHGSGGCRGRISLGCHS